MPDRDRTIVLDAIELRAATAFAWRHRWAREHGLDGDALAAVRCAKELAGSDVPALIARVRELKAAPADTIEIPCRMHKGKTHPLTLREAAVVIVTTFAITEDTISRPGTYNADSAQCVKEILNIAGDGEGYYEHVTSLLGPDAIDYPDVTA